MTLQQMEYIVALDKYRHFVLAAEACGVTQPTLSAMIQKLEEELDVKIFSRDRKNISPTAIGEKIIRQARIALNETQRIREVVADESSSMNGSLRIGILPTIAPYLVPDFIYHFRNTYPNVNLSIDEKGIEVAGTKEKKPAPRHIDCDAVVLSLGSRPVNNLAKELEGKVERLFVVGDASKVGRIANATAAAYNVAVNLK